MLWLVKILPKPLVRNLMKHVTPHIVSGRTHQRPLENFSRHPQFEFCNTIPPQSKHALTGLARQFRSGRPEESHPQGKAS